MHPESTAKTGQSGSAFWFILLAIALLAALAVTVTRSSGTAEQSGDVERARIEGSDMMRYAAAIESAIGQMRLNGTSENAVSFENDFVSGYTNANCGAGDGCFIFDRDGAGLSYKEIGDADWIFSGANAVTDVGTAASDLIMMMPLTDAKLCARINTELGLSVPTQNTAILNIGTPFTGTFTASGIIDTLPGKKTGCFQGNQDENTNDISANYYFYHMLIPR